MPQVIADGLLTAASVGIAGAAGSLAQAADGIYLTRGVRTAINAGAAGADVAGLAGSTVASHQPSSGNGGGC